MEAIEDFTNLLWGKVNGYFLDFLVFYLVPYYIIAMIYHLLILPPPTATTPLTSTLLLPYNYP